MKTFIAVLMLVALTAISYGQSVSSAAPLTIRPAGALETTGVAELSTATIVQLGIKNNYKLAGIEVYTDVTLGSLTNVTITPVASVDGTNGNWGYNPDYTKTYNASKTYMTYIPAEQLGACSYFGVSVNSSGTIAGNSVRVRVKAVTK